MSCFLKKRRKQGPQEYMGECLSNPLQRSNEVVKIWKTHFPLVDLVPLKFVPGMEEEEHQSMKMKTQKNIVV